MKTTHAAAADQAATATPDNPLRYLPIEDIIESCTHVQRARRARYSDQGLEELAESINRSGVLQPILVRPFNGSNIARSSDGEPPSFEIVAGERRFLASKRAGLRQIPAIVRELTDEHVLETQLAFARLLISQDARWLASHRTSAALCERYGAALGPEWRSTVFENSSDLRRRLGLAPLAGPTADDDVRRLRALLDEVRHCFTTDDALPDDLLPRIDRVLDGGTL